MVLGDWWSQVQNQDYRYFPSDATPGIGWKIVLRIAVLRASGKGPFHSHDTPKIGGQLDIRKGEEIAL